MARFLRLEKEEAGRILNESRERFEKGLLGENRRFEPRPLYFRALQAVHADGQIDSQEEQMLQGLRKMFSISDEEHAEFLKTIVGSSEESAISVESTPMLSETPFSDSINLEPGSTTGHLAARLEINRHDIWFQQHCNWYQVHRHSSDQGKQAWTLFINGILHGDENVMYDGLDMIDNILNARGEIAIADVMLALGVLHWSRVLLKTRLSVDQAGAAREWPLERLYLRLSIKMGPILISIDDLRIREGIEQLFSSVFVDLLEDLCMLIECNHARPVSMVVEMLRMLFRIAPKAGITHRAADLLTLLAQAAARIGGRLLSAFVLACRDLSTLQPKNHPLVIAYCQALLAIAPENDRPGKNYQPPISRPSSNKPYEPALQRL